MIVSRPLILASTSVYRRQLMAQLGISFEAVAPLYEEEHDLPLSPEELVVTLATKKVRSLASNYPRALLIGCDQVAELDGKILLKPGIAERARTQLAELSGRTHRLLTGLVVYDPGQEKLEYALDVHRMTMRHLTAEQIAAYVERDQPLGCAGAYKIEGAGFALMTAMEGSDHMAIIGLPLTKLITLLLRFSGVELTFK